MSSESSGTGTNSTSFALHDVCFVELSSSMFGLPRPFPVSVAEGLEKLA
jgi:hypothetical protein